MDEWFDQLVEDVKAYLPQVDRDRLGEAYTLSEKAYKSLKEAEPGNDFIVRPRDVVDILISFGPDEDTIIAAFLYDLLGVDGFDFHKIEEKFGEDVVGVLEGLQLLKTIKVVSYQSADKLDLLRKLFLVMAKDIRVLIVFLAVKVSSMELLEKLPKDCAQAFSAEVLEIFVPIAGRLGIYRFKTILEDYCFKYLNPDVYEEIADQLGKLGERKKEYITSVCSSLRDFYEEKGFSGVKVSGRLKGFYSVHNKMKKKSIHSIDGIHDIFAVRVILPTKYTLDREEDVSKIYEALGSLHGKWKPIASRFKDFVAVPKPNGYRSLHTSVMGLSDGSQMFPVEVQIRSQNMHEEAEYGVASHWLYKDTRGKGFSMLKSHGEWLKNLTELHFDEKSDEKTLDSLKLDVFGDRIYVLTPRGDVKELPKGATPLDFAYVIHTDVGHRCVLTKVNGKPVSLDTELENGDTVEVVTRKDGIPKLEWLSVVKMSHAKVKIKAWFAGQDKQKNVKRGRDQLNTQLRRFGKPILTPSLSILKNFGGQKLSSYEREKLLEEIGKGSQSAANTIRKIYVHKDLLEDNEKLLKKKDKKVAVVSRKLTEDVLIGGVSGMKVKIAKCCTPAEGDKIVGYVSAVSDSATIHKMDCPLVKRLTANRRVPASFRSDEERRQKSLYRVEINIEADSRLGMLGDIGSTIAASKVNIVAYNSLEPFGTGIDNIMMRLDVESLEQFGKVLDSIERINGVHKVIKTS